MRIPFAVITDTEGQVREYWGPNDGFGGARVHDPKGLPGQWKQWDELCGGDEVGESIFGDGLGAYKCPIYYLYFDSNKQNDQLAQLLTQYAVQAVNGQQSGGETMESVASQLDQ